MPEAGAPADALGFYVVAARSLARLDEHQLEILRQQPAHHGPDRAQRHVHDLGSRPDRLRLGNARQRPARQPGAPRLFASLLCGMSGYMALLLSGVAIKESPRKRKLFFVAIPYSDRFNGTATEAIHAQRFPS